jgi:LCP family protein required for cell wall assembly
VEGSRSTTEKHPSRAKRTSNYTLAIRLLMVGFILSTFIAATVLYHVVRDLTANYTGMGLDPFEAVGGNELYTPEPGSTPTLISIPVQPNPWDGVERVTILIMGVDYRDWLEGAGAPRSDTMMLVSLDPITNQASLMSIPRDLWVEIPGFGYNRINTAYRFGESAHLPGGGPALAMQTVEKWFGVPIGYYAVIDFHTFEDMIDEIGGIDVVVEERIKISAIDRHQRWLEPGPQHLDGPDALAYARVRKNAGGDFGRADRQQQVVVAVLNRLVSLDMLPSLIQKAPRLYQELSEGVRTNLSLEQMVQLAWSAIKLDSDDIHRGVIGPPKMVGFYTRPDGAQVLRAVPDAIRVLRDELFVETSAFGPSLNAAP